MSEKTTKWVIQAVSQTEDAEAGLRQIVALLKQQQEITLQATLSARTGAIQQVTAIEAVTDALNKQRTTTTQGANQQKSALGLIKSEYDTLGKTLNGITQIMAGMWVAGQAADYIKQVIAAKSAQDGFAVSLENMLKSKVRADEINAQLMAIAIKSPFEVEQVQKVTTQLVGMGVAVQDIIPYINMLGDISAVVGTSKLPLIAKALLDVKNKGILMKQELNQFAENGVPLYDLLAVSMGKARDEVVKLAEAHTITFKDVEKALKTATAEGGRYYGQMAAQSQTLAGQVAALSDQYVLAQAAVGDFFEDEIKGGIAAMQDLLHETIGSQAAIARLVDVVKAAASAYVTYRLAVNTLSSAKKAAAAETVALTATEVGATVATGGLTGAFNALKVAFATNPIGLVLTGIGALITAFYSYKAIAAEVTDEQNYQSDALRKSNKEFEIATKAVMQHAEGTAEYKTAVDNLIAKYPEYFAGLEKEAINNRVLNGVLMNVNESFQERIRLANLAYKADGLTQKAIELDREQLEIVTKLREQYEKISAANPNDEAFINALKEKEKAYQGYANAAGGGSFFGTGNDLSSASAIISAKKAIEKELIKIKDDSEKEQAIITARSLDQQMQLLVKQLNSKEITQKEFNNKVAALKGQEVETHAAAEDSKAKKGKQTTELALENQLKVLKAEKDTFFNRQDILDVEEKLDIERAVRTVKNKKDESDRVLSIQKEYAAKRAKLLEDSIDYELVDLKKVQEQADKEFKIRNTLSEDIEDLTLHMNGLILKEEEDKARRIAELGQEILETQKDLNRATIALGEMEAVENKKWWQSKAKVVAEYYLDINQKAAAAAKEQERLAQEEYDHYLKVFGADDELTKKAEANLIKAKAVSKDAIAEVKKSLLDLANITKEDLIKAAQTAMQVVDMMAQNFIDTTKLAAEGLRNVAGQYDKQIDFNRANLKEQLKDTSLSYDERVALLDKSIEKERDLLKSKGSMLLLGQQLDNAAARTESTMGLIKTGLETVVAFATGDWSGGIIGAIELVNGAFNHAALLQEQRSLIALNREKMQQEQTVQLLEYEMEMRGELHTQRLKEIGDEEQAFREGKQSEISAAKDTFDAQRDILSAERDVKVNLLNEQLDAIKDYYDAEIAKAREAFAIKQGLDEQAASDSKALLEASTQFRNQTLDAWEAREVKRLEDERDRNLSRAKSDDDYRQIAEFYATEIADVHKTKQDAMLDTSLSVKLGMEELSAQLKDTTIQNKNDEAAEIKRLEDEKQAKAEEVQSAILKVNTDTKTAIGSLENALKVTVTGLQNSIKQNATEMEQQRIAENANYKNFAMQAQHEIAQQQKQLAILEIKMEIAKLRAQSYKLFANKDAIAAAINEMVGLVNEINASMNDTLPTAPVVPDTPTRGGTRNDGEGTVSDTTDGGRGGGSDTGGGGNPRPKFHGDTWLKRENGEPYGIDTIPIMAHVGERIMQSYINAKLGPHVSNEELADGYLNYQKLIEKMPDLNLRVNAMGKLNIPVHTLSIPAAQPNPGDQANAALRRDIRGLKKAVDKLKILNVNVDGNAISISEQMANQKINYYESIYNS